MEIVHSSAIVPQEVAYILLGLLSAALAELKMLLLAEYVVLGVGIIMDHAALLNHFFMQYSKHFGYICQPTEQVLLLFKIAVKRFALHAFC